MTISMNDNNKLQLKNTLKSLNYMIQGKYGNLDDEYNIFKILFLKDVSHTIRC